MATAVAFSQINPDRAAQVRVTLANDLVSIVKDANRGVNVVVRDLRPYDLNNATILAAITTGALTANVLASDAYSTWTNLTAVQALGIYAFTNVTASPSAHELQFVAGPYTLAIVEFGFMYATPQAGAYIVDPIVWVPTEHVNIGFVGTTTQTDTIAFQGYLVEQDKTVAPPRVTANRNGMAVVAGHV